MEDQGVTRNPPCVAVGIKKLAISLSTQKTLLVLLFLQLTRLSLHNDISPILSIHNSWLTGH